MVEFCINYALNSPFSFIWFYLHPRPHIWHIKPICDINEEKNLIRLIKEIEDQTKKLALALKVKGFMNVQFAIKKDKIYVIEVNPRASRTVPFVSKAKGIPLAKIASRIMAGEKLTKFNLKEDQYFLLVYFEYRS